MDQVQKTSSLSQRRAHLEEMKRKFLNPDGTPKEGEETDTATWIQRLEDQIVEEETADEDEYEKLRRAFPPALLRLCQLLKDELELCGKLIEALETQAWLVTISCQKRLKPDDPHDLQHFRMNKGYPVGDIVSSLKCIAADFTAKENPSAELPKKDGWV